MIGLVQAFDKLDLLRPHAQPAVIDAAQFVLFAIYTAWALLAARRFHPTLTHPGRWQPATRC